MRCAMRYVVKGLKWADGRLIGGQEGQMTLATAPIQEEKRVVQEFCSTLRKTPLPLSSLCNSHYSFTPPPCLQLQ